MVIPDIKFLDPYLIEDRKIQNTVKDQEYRHGLRYHGYPAWFRPAVE